MPRTCGESLSYIYLDPNEHYLLRKGVASYTGLNEHIVPGNNVTLFFLPRQGRLGIRFKMRTKGSFPATPRTKDLRGWTDERDGPLALWKVTN